MIPSLALGGAERITLTLARSLVQRGHTVDLVVGNADGPLRAEVPDGVPLVDLGVRHLRAGVPALTRYLRRSRPAALLPTIGHADLLALLAARLADTGTVVIPRISNTLSQAGRGESLRVRATRSLTRRLYTQTPVLVACSQGMARDLIDHVGVAPDQVRVLPNASVQPGLRRLASEPVDHPWLLDDRVPTLLTVGSLIPQKNHRLLLEALARVRAVRTVRCIVLGEGPLRGALEQAAVDLGCAEHVDFAGADPNPFRAMARCDAFVLSSDWEGLPGVLIEALALQTNIVATDCPSGPREILDGGRHGRLVPPGDPEALARAIMAALDCPRRPGPDAAAPWTGAVAAAAYEHLLEEVGVW